MDGQGEDSIEHGSMNTVDPALMDVREEIFELSPWCRETLKGTGGAERKPPAPITDLPARSSAELMSAHTATSK